MHTGRVRRIRREMKAPMLNSHTETRRDGDAYQVLEATALERRRRSVMAEQRFFRARERILLCAAFLASVCCFAERERAGIIYRESILWWKRWMNAEWRESKIQRLAIYYMHISRATLSLLITSTHPRQTRVAKCIDLIVRPLTENQ